MSTASTFGYARPEDGVYIGYRVDGEGPIDIVWQPDWPGNIDMEWQDPLTGSWLRALSSFARVITHDHRGVGLSSRNVDLPTLETRVADLLAVLRATGTRRPVLAGAFSSGAVHALLAATYPTRLRSLVWVEPSARYGWASDYPWGATEDDRDIERGFMGLWGTDAYARTFAEDEDLHENPLPPEHIPQHSRTRTSYPVCSEPRSVGSNEKTTQSTRRPPIAAYDRRTPSLTKPVRCATRRDFSFDG